MVKRRRAAAHTGTAPPNPQPPLALTAGKPVVAEAAVVRQPATAPQWLQLSGPWVAAAAVRQPANHPRPSLD